MHYFSSNEMKNVIFHWMEIKCILFLPKNIISSIQWYNRRLAFYLKKIRIEYIEKRCNRYYGQSVSMKATIMNFSIIYCYLPSFDEMFVTKIKSPFTDRCGSNSYNRIGVAGQGDFFSFHKPYMWPTVKCQQ